MNVDKAQLLMMTKEQLVELLVKAIDGQMKANENMAKIVGIDRQLKSENEALVGVTQQLSSEKETLEARIRVLEGNPYVSDSNTLELFRQVTEMLEESGTSDIQRFRQYVVGLRDTIEGMQLTIQEKEQR
jgi:hypothetical protein